MTWMHLQAKKLEEEATSDQQKYDMIKKILHEEEQFKILKGKDFDMLLIMQIAKSFEFKFEKVAYSNVHS